MNGSFQRKSEHLANLPDARLHMVRQYTQCTGTVRIIAPSPDKGKWALGLVDKLEFVDYIGVPMHLRHIGINQLLRLKSISSFLA